MNTSVGGHAVVERSALGSLFDGLRGRGFRVVGPTVRGRGHRPDELSTPEELPAGWRDVQDGGHYRLQRQDDGALFAHAAGPQSWKQFLFPSRTLLWRAARTDGAFEVCQPASDETRYAFIGVRSCDLHAIAVQDKVFLDGPEPDPCYRSRRSAVFVVAVSCTVPGGTCFCVSMGTGPRAERGFDLGLTEILDGDGHRFVVEVGSAEGAALLGEMPHAPAPDEEVERAEALVSDAADRMGRTMDASGLHELMATSHLHPRWDDVAARCLTCANCTMVCPTCFCSTVEDVTDLTGEHAERWRRWDSCFTADFSYIHGGTVRASVSRYRQWLTHKLGTWHDQFGSRVASGAAAASPGARWASTSPRRWRPCGRRRPPRPTDGGRHDSPRARGAHPRASAAAGSR